MSMEVDVSQFKGYKRWWNTYTVRGKATIMGVTLGTLYFGLKFRGMMKQRRNRKENAAWAKEA